MFQASVMAEAPLCGIFVSFLLFVPPPLLSSSSDFPAFSPSFVFMPLVVYSKFHTCMRERSGQWERELELERKSLGRKSAKA